MKKQKTVADFYNITSHEIAKLSATKEPYWMKVSEFWYQVKDRWADAISTGQANWLSKIEADLEDNWRPKWMQEEGNDV